MKVTVVITFFLLSMYAYGQSAWQPYPPMSLQPVLKGNYGELRNNHFHSGIDLSTKEKVGQAVRVSDNGFVSRIKVSEYGYGKAIYIDHPNGYTTVYGHLHHFAPAIEALVREEQLKQQKFSVELFPGKGAITVKRGDTIAWSGNSGGSGGPHLHYEIRDTKTEKPLNPQRFITNVADTIAPLLKSITVYAMNLDFTQVNELATLKPLRRSASEFVVESPVSTSAIAGLGYSAVDYANDDSAWLGVYEMTLYVGEQMIYGYRMENFAFDETRNINGHIDYAKKQSKGIVSEYCFRLPGNTFSQYRHVVENGVIRMDSLKSVTLKLVLKDIKGNSVTCLIPLKYDSQIRLQQSESKGQKVFYNRKTEIDKDGYRLTIPEGALFRNIFYSDSEMKIEKGFYSKRYKLFEANEPIKKNLPLAIKVKNTHSELTGKLLLAKISDKGLLSAESSIYKNGFVSGNISTFGTYVVTIDTIPPVIGKHTMEYDSLYNCRVIAIKVKDNLSGIKTYSVKINDNWYWSEFDFKNDRILIYLTQPFSGTLKLEITVGDGKENFSVSKQEVKL